MNKRDTMDNKSILMDKLLYKRIGGVMIKYRRTTIHIAFCVVMFGLINVNILYYSFSTLYQMCNLRQSL